MDKLTFAIQMEIDGEAYYLSQAEKNKNNSLHRAFILLAEAEKKHADLLREKRTPADRSPNDDLPDEPITLFTGKADYMRDADVVPGQLEVYVFALDMEKKSIALYQEILNESTDEPTKRLLDFIIKQEQDHYAFFDELITLLSRPRDWVEDAEFGSRQDY